MGAMGLDEGARNGLVLALDRLCPGPTHLMALLGEPVDQQFVSAFCDRYGVEWLQLLLDRDQAVPDFKAVWRHVHGREHWELLELLVCEHWISTYPCQVALSLGTTMQLDKTLHTIRGAIAVALFARAKSVNWREPLTFVRALRVAEVYLSIVVENSSYTRPETRPTFEGRLGVCRVLQSRYVDLSSETLKAAIANLESSFDGGNQAAESFAYRGEALVRYYDESSDPTALTSLIKLADKLGPSQKSATLDASVADAWLRLADEAPARSARYARNALDIAHALKNDREPLIFARAAILEVLAQSRIDGVKHLSVRGLRLPFGLKRQLRDWAQVDLGATVKVAQEVVAEIRKAPAQMGTDPILRRIDASARSALGELLPQGTRTRLRADWISSAVAVRSSAPGRSRLSDPESALENVLDLFSLCDLLHDAKDPSTFVAALEAALLLADFDQAWPTPIIVLARELEKVHAQLTPPGVYRLKKLSLHSPEVLNCVLAHDPPGLYEIAAKRALASREVDRKHIGGRTGVYLAEDYSGVVKDNFVFKPTLRELADREDSRAEVIRKAIEIAGRSGEFQLAQTMARSDLPAGDPLRQLDYDVIVARQFHSGEILADYVKDHADRPAGEDAMRKAVGFLALIHAAERSDPNPGLRMRKQVRQKEFGRWLKALRIEDPDVLFELWWERMSQLPCFVRRDAHPLNWIVTPNRNIIALDLEGCGWRPAGYELAQLTDDHPLIPVDKAGWRLRRELIKVYRDHLAGYGVHLEHWPLEDAYEAALIARATRLLTEPSPLPGSRDHGVALLRHLGKRARRKETRQIAEMIRKAWLVRVGVTSEVDQDRQQISAARRRHISRALAYELRHGTRVRVDESGWATVGELTKALNDSGLRTGSSELRTVANAIDEPRFEVAGERIRARYGHTRAVRIAYTPQTTHRVVYHGTAVSNLNQIFAGEGLKSMGRLWVHLSSSAPAALRTAKRHGPSALLAINCDEVQGGVLEAGGNVYLAKAVSPDAIRIVTPTELFLMGNQTGD